MDCINPTSSNKTVISWEKWVCLSYTSTANKGGVGIRTPNSGDIINRDENNTQILLTPRTSVEESQFFIKNSNLVTVIESEVKEVVLNTIGIELFKIHEELSSLLSIKTSIDYLSKLFDKVKKEFEEAKTEIVNLKKGNQNLKEIIAINSNTINLLKKEEQKISNYTASPSLGVKIWSLWENKLAK